MLRRISRVTYGKRLRYDALVQPEYGFWIYTSALLARALGYHEISVIEFGVGSGAGLVNVGRHVQQVHRELGVDFQVYGFDTGSGMPKSQDYRDMLYMWDEGLFAVDRQTV